MLREGGYPFDVAYTSVLKRAHRTCGSPWTKPTRCGSPSTVRRLNERHYGALQGLNKAETADKFGQEQVHAVAALL